MNDLHAVSPDRGAPVRPSSNVLRALGRAAARATETLRTDPHAPDVEAPALLEQLVDTVSATVRGDSAARAARAIHAPAVAPRYVAALREALLDELAAAGHGRVSGKDLLAVLRALEAAARPADAPSAAEYAENLAASDTLNGMLEIAHDMRSPLAAILLLVEPMRRGAKGPVTPVQERQLGLVYGAALSLSALANDILEAARGRTRAQSALRPFSISETIADACRIVRPIAEEKRLELALTFPVVDGRLGDAPLIHRVLLNLTSNALKYTESGSVAVGCTELDERRVEFWVRDTGLGIPADALAMLTEGLSRSRGRSHFSSAGLGLAICRTLLEHMGSALIIDSNGTAGTRCAFVLDLPPTPTPAPG